MRSKNIFLKLSYLRSMRLGITLLLLITALSITGIIIPQGGDADFYNAEYTAFIAAVILRLGLDHIYSSMTFALFFSVLAINLFLCNTARLSSILNRLKQRRELDRLHMISSYSFERTYDFKKAAIEVFGKYGFSKVLKSNSSDLIYFSSKNTLGYFGSWFLHLGIMLVILFYIYGQATYYSQELYGVPREIRSINKTDLMAIIRDFQISYRDDGSIKQYTTQIDLLDGNNKILKKGSISVNNPMRYGGYSFYQTGTGWAVQCRVYKKAVPIRAQTLYEGMACNITEENIAIALTKFYPDFAANDKGFFSLSDKPNNPAILGAIYYMGEMVKMDIIKPGENIKWNDFEFVLDNPQRYTYLQVNKMNGRIGAGAGSLLIILGLLLVFYFKPGEMGVYIVGDTLQVFGGADFSMVQSNRNKGIKLKLIENKEEGIDVR